MLSEKPRIQTTPGEGDVLDSELDYTREEPLFNSTIDARIDAAATLRSTTSAESQSDDGHSDGM